MPDSRDATGATPERCAVTIVVQDIGAVGGMERVLGELALGLLRRGHEVHIVARKCALDPDAGFVFHRVPGPGRPFSIAYPWFVFLGSLILRRARRGVVHVTGAIVCNRADVVAVHYVHRVGPAQPSRDSLLYRLQVKSAGVLKRAGEWLYYRPSRGRAFVCVSDGVADEMREHYPKVADRVLTIHNGVDTSGFRPGARKADALELRERLELAPDALVAAFVGSEWGRKGLEPLIRALGEAPEWTAVVAGPGDRERYGQLADSVGAGDRVRFLGVLHDVAPVYELADAFVLPTSYETFSLVTFEAAAMGLPVLAAPVNGVRELIVDARNGFVISRDPALIARRLRELGADPGLRSELGRQAREDVQRFSWERMVTEHVELYERLARTP